MENCDFLIKLIIVGDSGVGKSSLISVYCDQIYDENYISTIGIDFRKKIIKFNGYTINLQIWDTAGQEKFRAIVSSYYRNSQAVMLIFDLNNASSFHNLSKWLTLLDKQIGNNYELLLVGNKCENTKMHQVTKESVENFCRQHKLNYIEVSAKENISVGKAFMKIIQQVMNSHGISIIDDTTSQICPLNVGLTSKNKAKKCC